MKNLPSRSAFVAAEVGARPAHPRKSWGVSGYANGQPAHVVFGWLDEIDKTDPTEPVCIGEVAEPKCFGSRERANHINRILMGEPGYLLFNRRKPNVEGASRLESYCPWLFKITELFTRDGRIYARWTLRE